MGAPCLGGPLVSPAPHRSRGDCCSSPPGGVSSSLRPLCGSAAEQLLVSTSSTDPELPPLRPDRSPAPTLCLHPPAWPRSGPAPGLVSAERRPATSLSKVRYPEAGAAPRRHCTTPGGRAGAPPQPPPLRHRDSISRTCTDPRCSASMMSKSGRKLCRNPLGSSGHSGPSGSSGTGHSISHPRGSVGNRPLSRLVAARCGNLSPSRAQVCLSRRRRLCPSSRSKMIERRL